MEKVVLIVEDEVLVGMLLARKMEEAGFIVCGVVGTGEEAIAVAERERPGAILMDVSLGGKLDGIETARELMDSMATPVIFFTGYNRDSRLLARAAEVKALAVLDKMGPEAELLAILEKAFS